MGTDRLELDEIMGAWAAGRRWELSRKLGPRAKRLFGHLAAQSQETGSASVVLSEGELLAAASDNDRVGLSHVEEALEELFRTTVTFVDPETLRIHKSNLLTSLISRGPAGEESVCTDLASTLADALAKVR